MPSTFLIGVTFLVEKKLLLTHRQKIKKSNKGNILKANSIIILTV